MGAESKAIYYCRVVDIMMQEELKNTLDNLTFARFMIISGASSIASEDIAECISARLQTVYIHCGNKVDDVRNIISMAYKQTKPIMYVFKDCDNMSNAAKNALLKVIEEPPQQAYFVMLLKSTSNTLATILSRGMLISLLPFPPSELKEYALQIQPKLKNEELTKIAKVCETPEQVKMLLNYGVQDFCDYVRKVVENIPEVTVTNCLKIANQINFKEEEDKYDLELFLNTYTNYLLECFIDGDYDKEQLDFSTQSTLKLKSILQYSGINKAMAFKKWLIQQWEILGVKMLNEEKIALLNVGDELYVGVIYKQRILYRHAKFLSYDPETRILKALGNKRNKNTGKLICNIEHKFPLDKIVLLGVQGITIFADENYYEKE